MPYIVKQVIFYCKNCVEDQKTSGPSEDHLPPPRYFIRSYSRDIYIREKKYLIYLQRYRQIVSVQKNVTWFVARLINNTHVGETPTCVGETPTCVGETPTCAPKRFQHCLCVSSPGCEGPLYMPSVVLPSIWRDAPNKGSRRLECR